MKTDISGCSAVGICSATGVPSALGWMQACTDDTRPGASGASDLDTHSLQSRLSTVKTLYSQVGLYAFHNVPSTPCTCTRTLPSKRVTCHQGRDFPSTVFSLGIWIGDAVAPRQTVLGSSPTGPEGFVFR